MRAAKDAIMLCLSEGEKIKYRVMSNLTAADKRHCDTILKRWTIHKISTGTIYLYVFVKSIVYIANSRNFYSSCSTGHGERTSGFFQPCS